MLLIFIAFAIGWPAFAEEKSTSLLATGMYEFAELQDHGTNQVDLPRFALRKPGLANESEWKIVSATEWLPGLIPIFPVTRQGRTELRWRPPRGQEMGSDPLFFGWPPSADPTTKWAGFWKTSATRADGSKTTPDFEITVRAGEIAGRFNHHTENKFATLAGGSITNNQVRIEVNYIQDNYRLEGRLENEAMQGTWKHLNGEEHGTWRAWREHKAVLPPPGAQLVDLFEWTNRHDNQKLYLPAPQKPVAGGWVRSEFPLCSVAITIGPASRESAPPPR